MDPEKIVKEEVIEKSKQWTITRHHALLANGKQISRHVVKSGNSVVIVPITENHEVRMIRQFRVGAREWIYELPAGSIEASEDPQAAAIRELAEETGDRARTWHSLGGAYSAPYILTEYLHFFLAMDLEPGQNRLQTGEHIQVHTIPWENVRNMCLKHQLRDAKTMAAIFQAGLHLSLIKF